MQWSVFTNKLIIDDKTPLDAVGGEHGNALFYFYNMHINLLNNGISMHM